MIGAWRVKPQRSVWPPPVVMGAELVEDGPQVPLTEDQDAVCEFGSGGQDESFGEAVRSRRVRAAEPAPGDSVENTGSSRSTARSGPPIIRQ
jgi:hypothetical protein